MLYVSFNIIFQVFHSNILSKEHCLPFTFQSSKVLLSSKKISSDLLQQQILCRILVPIFILVLHFCCCGKKTQINSNLDGEMWYFSYIRRSQARTQRQEMNESTWRNITYRLALHGLLSYFSYTNQFHLLRDGITHSVLGPLTPNSNHS